MDSDRATQEPEPTWRDVVEWWRSTRRPSEPADGVRCAVACCFLEGAQEAVKSEDKQTEEQYIKEALTLLSGIREVEELDFLWQVGYRLQRLGRNSESIGILLKAFDLARVQSGDEETLAQIASSLESAYSGVNEFDSAAYWARKWTEWAERATRPGGPRAEDGDLHFRLGLHYSDMGRADLAVGYYEKADRLGVPEIFEWFVKEALAYDLEVLGRWEEAIPLWQSLLELARGDEPSVKLFAERLGYARGRLDAKLRRRTRPGPREIITGPRKVDMDAPRVEVSEKVKEEIRKIFEQLREKDTGKELERILPVWGKFEESTRLALVSAESLYHEHSSDENFDWGQIADGYIKALELELKARVIRPFKAWLTTHSKNKIRSRNREYLIDDLEKLTLRQLMNLFQNAGRGESPEIKQWVETQHPRAEEFLLRQLHLGLLKVVPHRDAAVHTADLSVTRAIQMRADILGSPEKPGLLGDLVQAIA